LDAEIIAAEVQNSTSNQTPLVFLHQIQDHWIDFGKELANTPTYPVMCPYQDR